MSDYLISDIGKEIKAIRKKNNIKLVDLAKKANISKGLLSKIENGRTVPSLPVFLTIVKALELNPSQFFKNLDISPQKKYIHKSEEDYSINQKEEEAKGFVYRSILEQGFENMSFESVILEVQPNAKRKKVSADAFEFKYILEGKLNYQIDDEYIELKKGDSLFYDGRLPHVPHNPYEETAKMLVIYLYNEKKID
ncbi:MAG: XRE family transcriptional regulator [Bacteroidota bacterium]